MKATLVFGAFLAAVLIASPVLAKQGDRSMKTADQRLVPFTVTGNEVRTVTVTLTQGSESK
jgi:hypothetical protein